MMPLLCCADDIQYWY